MRFFQTITDQIGVLKYLSQNDPALQVGDLVAVVAPFYWLVDYDTR